ncbi:hypothetical protein AVEN_192390-1 [Araneus ventricosus]|uniref:Uncharacterized protein n=1 Tax=Araneus ventricosus TaxID=182803 RepID=A0A4Y2H980_ARAVE|nr:hypothetical protein AVEN_192390-1 [Araneus ventricosus]
MEKQLSYVLTLSLEEMALRKIAVILINVPDFLATTENFPFELVEFYQSQWLDTVEWKIRDKMSNLKLPESLARQMIPTLKAVGTEILKWKLFHNVFLNDPNEHFDVHVVEKLCWTTAGTVDYRKTAETLVRSNVVDIVKRFKLACLYCLEDYIPVIWKELPEENKKFFYNGEDKEEVKTPHLWLFLPYILENIFKLHNIQTPTPRNSFKYSALFGHKTLTEYCFQKFSKEDREASLVQTAKDVVRERNPDPLADFEPTHEKLSDVLCYLLSLMTPEEQMRIFKALPCEVLRCFLDWPWQKFFLDIADIIWTFLPKRKYNDLLSKISIHIGNSGYYFPNFFQEFFLRSPRSFRKCFVDQVCRLGSFLQEFFITEDSKTIEVIFRNIDAADRVRLVFSEHVFKLLNDFLLSDRWRIVEVCIREATLSKENRERLRGAFMEFVTRTDGGVRFNWRTQKRKRFFEFLDEMDASPADKRSPEDETLTKVKKSRSGEENDVLPRN